MTAVDELVQHGGFATTLKLRHGDVLIVKPPPSVVGDAIADWAADFRGQLGDSYRVWVVPHGTELAVLNLTNAQDVADELRAVEESLR